MFDALGVDIGIGAVPKYQDLNLKLDFPGTKLGGFSLTGIGGINHIEIDLREDNEIDFTGFESIMLKPMVRKIGSWNMITGMKTMNQN